jgi:uncharacterized protein YpmS
MRWVKRILLSIFVLLLLVGAGVGWLVWSAMQIPEFYQRADAARIKSPKERRKVARKVTEQTQTIVEKAQAAEPWEYELTEAELNSWIVEELPKHLGGQWPKELQDPRVAFEKDKVLIGAMVNVDGWKGVGALRLKPRIGGGRVLFLDVDSFTVGSVPIPIERWLDEMPEVRAQEVIERDRKTGRYRLRLELGDDVSEKVHLEKVEVTPGRLRLTGK